MIKALLASSAVLLLGLGWPASASATDFNVYLSKATLSGFILSQTNGIDTLPRYHLNTAKFINLALGQPLDSPTLTHVLAIAVDINAAMNGDPAGAKRLLVVNTDPADHRVLATIILSEPSSVCNAQSTNHTFHRYGFGGGDIQMTGNGTFGTTGGRVQMSGILRKREVYVGRPAVLTTQPVLTQTVVGSFDMVVNGFAETFFVNAGVLTSSGAPIGSLHEDP